MGEHWTGMFVFCIQQHTWGNTEQARLLSEYNSNSPTWASDLLIQLLELTPIIWGSMLPATCNTWNVVLKFNDNVPPPPPPPLWSPSLILPSHLLALLCHLNWTLSMIWSKHNTPWTEFLTDLRLEKVGKCLGSCTNYIPFFLDCWALKDEGTKCPSKHGELVIQHHRVTSQRTDKVNLHQ